MERRKHFLAKKYLSAYLTPDCNNIYIIGRHQLFLNLHIFYHNISAEVKLAFNTLRFNMPHLHLNQRVVCCFIIPLQFFHYNDMKKLLVLILLIHVQVH